MFFSVLLLESRSNFWNCWMKNFAAVDASSLFLVFMGPPRRVCVCALCVWTLEKSMRKNNKYEAGGTHDNYIVLAGGEKEAQPIGINFYVTDRSVIALFIYGLENVTFPSSLITLDCIASPLLCFCFIAFNRTKHAKKKRLIASSCRLLRHRTVNSKW